MKRLFTALCLSFFGFAAASAQAVAKFDKTSHNFGTFDESKAQTHVFYVTNTGDEPLVIHQALSTCGCTVPEFTKTPIAPGERGEIKVTYVGKGRVPGYFKKTITIRSNAEKALTRLYVEGTMNAKKD